MTEATIIINGQTLTEAQSMTMRVSISSHIVQMSLEGALGEDAMGEALRKLYFERSAEIIKLIGRSSPPPQDRALGTTSEP